MVRRPEFWLSEICANPVIPPQKPQKGDNSTYIYYINSQLSWATLHGEGFPLRRVLQEGLRVSAAQNRGLGGDVRLKSGGHLLLFLLLAVRHNGDLARTAKTKLLPQGDISTCR